MQTTGKLSEISVDFKTKKTKISIILDSNKTDNIEALNGLKLNIELKKWSKKRSLDCNAYMWVLIQEIAEKISTPELTVVKEDIYRDAIKTIGAFTIVPIRNDAVEEWIRIWKSNGIGWICDTQPSKLKGFTNVMCYHGSSIYTQQEMNRLVNLIVEECRNLGIETKSKAELDNMVKEWKI